MSAEPSSLPKRLSAVDRRLARRADAGDERSSPPPLTSRNLGRLWPLSPAQRRLLLLDQLDTGSPAYAIARALNWRGRLVPLFFGAAMSRVVARHGALRLAPRLDEAGGRGHLLPPRPVVLPWVDLSALRSTGGFAARLSGCFSRGRLDLAAGRVWQSAWLRLEASHHRWLFRVHHVVFDGVSMGLMLTELATHYDGFESGRPVELPPLTVEYGDFVLWHDERQKSTRALAQLDWWRQQLAGLGSEPELLADRPGGSDKPGRWANLLMPEGFGARLSLAAAASGTSPFVLQLAALVALLHRGHGRRRCRLASPAAGRQRLELEPLIGLLTQTLLLTPEVEPGWSFAELVASLRRHLGLVLAHQEMPFERVSEALGLDGRGPAGGSGAFQLMFAEQADPLAAAPEFAGAEVSCENLESGVAALDLFLEVRRQGAEILLRAGYRSDRFEATTIRRWLGRYLRLLEAAIAEPGCRLAELPLLSPAERTQLLREWSRSSDPEPGEEGLHGGFVTRTAASSESIALVEDDASWSFGAALREARRLAAALLARGLGPEAPIGVRMERGAAQVVAVLGVLLSGAAYLPLEAGVAPTWAAERLAAAGARLVIETPAAGREGAEEAPPVARLGWSLSPARGLGAGSSAERVAAGRSPLVDAEQLAYLIFTSGSSGTPKAVAVPHRAARAYTASAQRSFGLCPSDRVLQLASLAFDASIEEIFPTLSAGATLVFRDEAMMATAGRFLARVAERAVTVLDLPTAFWQSLVAEVVAENLGPPACLRLVILGGERVQAEPARVWCRHLAEARSGLRTVNTYGPTESTVVATSWWLPRRPWGSMDPPVPLIGRPVAGVVVRVLGRDLRPLPIGAAGELGLGGVGLARGYLGRPGRTAECFRPDPVATSAGERLYSTGDLVRFRADGNLESLGRVDRQLKVRGFRIEPAEIEARLLEHPAIGAAAVEPASRIEGGAVDGLVAYLVAAPGRRLAIPEVASFLAARLPAALLPNAFLELDRLPLGSQGKLDRAALPSPDQVLNGSGGLPHRPPGTAVERLLADLWRQVLGGPEPGLDDDFFRSGGHSLAAMQLVSRLEREVGIFLPLATILRSPRFEQLAAAVEDRLLAEEPREV